MESIEVINETWKNFIKESTLLVVTGIFASLTVLLRKKIIAFLNAIAKELKKILFEDEHLGKKVVERDMRIQDLLSQLRFETKADRCYILQFHNGSMFTCKNPMWKVSCTNESVTPGIKAILGNVQQILSSSIGVLLVSLWDNDLLKYSGIVRISPEKCKCDTKINCRMPSGVIFYDVMKLEEGYTKGLLCSHGTKYMLHSPIINKDGNVVGITCSDYCWEDANQEEIQKHSYSICRISSAISYELSN